MKGIYFINDRICLNGLSREESFVLQKCTINRFIEKNNIEIVKLNPYQLYEYYTNPHALLYDLKKKTDFLDCFLHLSPKIIEDYLYTYPARWLILKSFFNEIIAIEEQKDLYVNKIG